MGAGGGGTPTLQLHAHAGTLSPTGTRYTRRVTPRHKRAHAGTPAPHRAAAPRGRGPALGRRAHAAPGPSSRRRHGGGDTRTHLSTTQPLARVGTRAVGAVPALAQLLAVALQPGLGRSRATVGISCGPPPRNTHVCTHAFVCAHVCMHTHACTFCTAHHPHLPQPPHPGLPGPVGSAPGSDGPRSSGPTRGFLSPSPLCDPAPPAPGPLPQPQPDSTHPDAPLPSHPKCHHALTPAGWGVQRWKMGRESWGEPAGQGGTRRPRSESHRLRLEQQAAAASPREGGLAAVAHVAAQPGAGQHLQCRGR